MLTVILRVLYFGSPILYDVREIADSTTPSAQAMATVLQFNPLTHILEIFHSAFCTKGEGWPRWPDATSWLLAAGCALLALLVGYFVYKTHEDRLIYKL
jgi:ABC-type polysaccharide/polyol phosphate export permease